MHHAPAVRHTRHSSSRHTDTIIRERPDAVNATSVLCALDLSLRHGAEPHGVTISPQATYPHYNKPSSREGILNRALFRAAVSLPPASARSGLPPPLPPTIGANACISLPAWTLAVRSLVTPAISATLPSSGIPSATTPEPSFWRRLSTSCLSPSRSTFCTSSAITLTPFTVCTREASSSSCSSAPFRF